MKKKVDLHYQIVAGTYIYNNGVSGLILITVLLDALSENVR